MEIFEDLQINNKKILRNLRIKCKHFLLKIIQFTIIFAQCAINLAKSKAETKMIHISETVK